MDLGLRGRTALILGASSGLGLACAESLREEGANVAMFARREELLRQEAARLGATAIVGDVFRHSSLENAAESTYQKYGRLDVLVLNSGRPAVWIGRRGKRSLSRSLRH